jgi:hypothetical protein
MPTKLPLDRKRSPRTAPFATAAPLLLGLSLLLPGCADEPVVTSQNPGDAAQAAAPAPEPPPIQRTPIVGAKTTDIRNADTELAKGDSKVADMRITAKDPITLSGNAYVTSIGRISIDHITHAMQLYEATNGHYPETYEEFMKEIIEANNIALPKLPEYQKYAYDEKEHKLIVLEYPDIKDRMYNEHSRRP